MNKDILPVLDEISAAQPPPPTSELIQFELFPP